MSRKTMLKNEKNKSIRVINKAFDKYPIEQQELMKQESTLIIYRSVKNKKFDSYADYMDFFKALTPEERTIIFCGIPIKLSKKQFAILSLLIREQKFYASEYAELEFKKKDKIKDKTGGTLRSFVSRFRTKCALAIKNYAKKNSDTFDTEKTLSLLDDLIFYELKYSNEYTLLTNFQLLKPKSKERVRVQK